MSEKSANHFIHPEQIEKIRSVQNFKKSAYNNLDIVGTIDYFTRRYVVPISKLVNISECTVVDSGCGYGWFSIAYIISGGKASIAVDIDRERLSAAKDIAKIFLVDDRIEFLSSPLEDIPLAENSADIFVSIETLEHLGKGKIQPALRRIKEIASKVILITTPNKLFPIIAHDTRLPFIHWLPPNMRRPISKLFKRQSMDMGNEFLTPFDLNSLLDKFKPASSCLTFQTYQEYLDHFPIYVPYGKDESLRNVSTPPRFKSIYYNIANHLLGTHTYWVMPTLTSVFVRRTKGIF